MEILNPFFKCQSQDFSLNYSDTRHFKICIESVIPRVEPVMKLTASDHGVTVQFSLASWNTLVQHANKIKEAMRQENEETIFVTEELKVFTEHRHEQCAACFFDQQGNRVNMMIKTFIKWMSHGSSISSEYNKLVKQVNKTAIQLKNFVHLIFTQLRNVNVDNGQFEHNLKEHLNKLCAPSSIKPEDAGDFRDSEEEDEYNSDDDDEPCWDCRHKRRRGWY